MASTKPNFVVTRSDDSNDVLSAKMPVAAVAGALVCVKSSTVDGKGGSSSDGIEFELASGKRAHFLTREVLDATEIPLATIMGRTTELVTPELKGNVVSAEKHLEIEVEGSALIDTATATRLIASGTANGSELTSLNGKWALRTDAATQELCGWLRGKLTPQTSGELRLVIEVAK